MRSLSMTHIALHQECKDYRFVFVDVGDLVILTKTLALVLLLHIRRIYSSTPMHYADIVAE